MSRPYISIGRGGPRIGVVLGRRDIGDIARISFVGVGAVAVLFGLLSVCGSLGPDYGPPVIIASPFVLMFALFWHASRKRK
jgi:hypothetical protein